MCTRVEGGSLVTPLAWSHPSSPTFQSSAGPPFQNHVPRVRIASHAMTIDLDARPCLWAAWSCFRGIQSVTNVSFARCMTNGMPARTRMRSMCHDSTRENGVEIALSASDQSVILDTLYFQMNGIATGC